MIRIGIFTDLQYADIDDVGGRTYRASISKFLEAAGFFDAEQPDFILHLGDAANGDWSNLSRVLELFSLIKLPFYRVLGNHDYLIGRERLAKLPSLFGLPDCGYHSFRQTDPESKLVWRFILLNGNEIATYSAKSDAERDFALAELEKYRLADGNLPQTWNGAMSERQLEWLDAELSSAEQNGERSILCSHFPLFSQGGTMDQRAKFGKLFPPPVFFSALGVSLWNGPALLDVIDRHDSVRAYLAGHLHEGAYGVRNGVPHITFRGMVQTEPNACALLTIQGEKLTVAGFGAQESF